MKLDRLLSIVVMMLNRDRVPAAELARRFEVSVRTIYRDVDAIDRLDRQVLTLSDMVSILSSLRSVSAAFDLRELETAQEKVRSLVPKDMRTEVDALQDHGRGRHHAVGIPSPREKQLMKEVYRALRAKRLVGITYRS